MKKDQEQNNTNQNDRFSQLMFGTFPPQRNHPQNKEEEPEIDFMQIINQIDSIIGSLNELKPMLKQLTPLLNIFKKS